MSGKTVAIGGIAKAFCLKSTVQEHLKSQGYNVIDVGCFGSETFVTFPSVGEAVAHAINSGEADFGVICCNYGSSALTGVAKYQGVSALACESALTAEMCRRVNGVNVLCMGQLVVSPELACQMVDVFLNTEFLDMDGVPPKIQEFRREARAQLIVRGEVPQQRDLDTLA